MAEIVVSRAEYQLEVWGFKVEALGILWGWGPQRWS